MDGRTANRTHSKDDQRLARLRAATSSRTRASWRAASAQTCTVARDRTHSASFADSCAQGQVQQRWSSTNVYRVRAEACHCA